MCLAVVCVEARLSQNQSHICQHIIAVAIVMYFTLDHYCIAIAT